MRLPTRAIRMLVVTVFPIIATASGPIEPFTEEAIARGVVYNMVGYANAYGRLGYGCGFADLDNDGDQDIIIVGADLGSRFLTTDEADPAGRVQVGLVDIRVTTSK